ncbi:MAG: hypothetical protein RQ741_05165 [Wenzhouxiangellaceae bacterium]|nr:hypothetical protein [Wenzhouxiangellaceae bacterium]
MTKHGRIQTPGYWRITGWGFLVLLLLIPLVAMQFTDEIGWTGSDFVLMGILFLALGLGFELAVRLSPSLAYRAAFGLAVLGAILLTWINLALGIIGSEDNPANLMYGSVLATGLIGAMLVRGRPRGLAATLLAMAGVQAAIAAIAILAGLGRPLSGTLELAALNGLFIGLFLTAAGLFRRTAQNEPKRDATPASQNRS